MIKKAMILAAGFGKRIRPLTNDCPKPLLKIGKETLLSNTIKFLSSFGVKEVVINVHYLGEQIIDYIKRNEFNLEIKIIRENEKILDTGGGVLNAIQYFSNAPFIIINPDTIWNSNYLGELELMKNKFINSKKEKCILLLVNKSKSFDKTLRGDFNLKKDKVDRNNNNKDNLNYIYTGLQIIKPEIFASFDLKIFSINKIWTQLIENDELHGVESKLDFLHVSTIDVYNNLKKKLNFK
tara:strand:+ start:158 stop:871 length:714 start_codon:yes stop_codon:yes gene_type:complete